MCGILGVIGPSLPGLDAALDTLAHRGPDGRGSWSEDGVWLGHRRLSIIDSEGGAQPMTDPETGVVITYNGEIYNYLELRRELEAAGHRFRSQSDTEVLLRAYLEWGTECLPHLNGMWSLVIWDPRERRAFFTRDRFGVKPCYYAVHDGRLLIASEPKALIAAAPALGAPDETAIGELLAHRRAHCDERTFYRQIRSLPAGHWGTFAPGDARPQIRRFWHAPEPEPVHRYDAPAVLMRFGELFDDAVSLRLRSDVPVGLTLSGGVDSTAILDATARVRARSGLTVTSYTAVYEDQPEERAADERKWARIASAEYANASLIEVNAAVDDWPSVMRRIVWHMDGPGFSPAVFPMWMIMQRARADGVPVLLEGQGADEQHGGYSHYAALAFLDRLRGIRRLSRGSLRGAAGTAGAGIAARSAAAFARDVAVALSPAVSTWQHRRSSLAGALLDPPAARSGDPVAPFAHIESRLEHGMRRDFSTDLLPAFLQYGDAISMAHSIETRLPFLDYRLVELSMVLPPAARIARGENKSLLRNHLRGRGQATIAERRDKRGYPTPAYEWMAADGGRILREQLLDPASRVGALVDRAALTGLIDRHAAGGYAAGDTLYALLATELWWQGLPAGA